MNIDSFPGTIQIQGSQFSQNMAYIKDYIIEQNTVADSYLQTSNIEYSDFEQQNGQVFFKICDSLNRGEYLVQ